MLELLSGQVGSRLRMGGLYPSCREMNGHFNARARLRIYQGTGVNQQNVHNI